MDSNNMGRFEEILDVLVSFRFFVRSIVLQANREQRELSEQDRLRILALCDEYDIYYRSPRSNKSTHTQTHDT